MRWSDVGGMPQANNRGELCVVQGLPPVAEIVRFGNSWVSTVTVSGPSTNALLQLYNTESPGGKSYLLDFVSVANVFSQAAAEIVAIQVSYGNSFKTDFGGAPANGGFANSLSGRWDRPSSYPGKAVVISPSTGPSDFKFRVGNSLVVANTSNANAGLEVPLNGRFIVPPQKSFLLFFLPPAGVIDITGSVAWHEVQLSLG
jgi:hypothetical protein